MLKKLIMGLILACRRELLRCNHKSGRELVVIDMSAAGYTRQYLQSAVASAKIYIRPLQKVDLSYSEDVSSINEKAIVKC